MLIKKIKKSLLTTLLLVLLLSVSLLSLVPFIPVVYATSEFEEGDYSSWAKIWQYTFPEGLYATYYEWAAFTGDYLTIAYLDDVGAGDRRLTVLNLTDGSTKFISDSGTDYTEGLALNDIGYTLYNHLVVIDNGGMSFTTFGKYTLIGRDDLSEYFPTQFEVWEDGAKLWTSPFANVSVTDAVRYYAAGIRFDGKYIVAMTNDNQLEYYGEQILVCFEGNAAAPTLPTYEGNYSSWSEIWEYDFPQLMDSIYYEWATFSEDYLTIHYKDNDTPINRRRFTVLNLTDGTTKFISTRGVHYTEGIPYNDIGYTLYNHLVVTDNGGMSFSIFGKYIIIQRDNSTVFEVWEDGAKLWTSPLASAVVSGATEYYAVGMRYDGNYIVALMNNEELVCFEGDTDAPSQPISGEGKYSKWEEIWEYSFTDGLENNYYEWATFSGDYLSVSYLDDQSPDKRRFATIDITDGSNKFLSSAGSHYIEGVSLNDIGYTRYNHLVVIEDSTGMSFSVFGKYLVIGRGDPEQYFYTKTFEVWKDGENVWTSPLAADAVAGASIYRAVGIRYDGKYIVALTNNDKLVCFESKYCLAYPFDDETSTTAYDWSDDDNDGTITGADRTYDGHFGMALDFDGTNYITVVDNDTLDLTSTIALSAWIKTSTVSGEQVIFDKPNAYGLYLFDDAIGMMINSDYYNSSTGVIKADTWYHIVGEYNASYINIYLDEVLIYNTSLSGAIFVSAFDLIIGDEYSGILDEMIISLSYSLDLVDPIASYPYAYNGYVDTTGCSWIVSTLTYNFTGVFIRQNSTYPITYAKINFTDNFNELGLSYTVSTTTFDCIGDEEDIEKIYLVSRSWKTSYNAYTLQGRIRIEEFIQSYSNVDLMLYCETLDSDDSLIIEDRFSIYGIGGITTTTIVGDGALIAGGSIFDIMATNSSLTGAGSSIRVDTVIPNFQHIHILTHLYQGALWDTDHFDCPTDDAETGYLEYGINYWICADEAWIEGWKVRIEVLDGDAGDHGVGSDMAWVLLNVTWWNAGDFIKYDIIYAFYEAYHENDLTTQFSLYIDLWMSSDEFSSNIAGHVSSQYYGMEETGWWLWADKGAKNALLTSSTFYDNLYDSDGNVTTASKLKMFQVWSKIAKVAEGEGGTSCDNHLWASMNEVLQIKQLPYNLELVGMLPPTFQPTTTPDMPVGFFATLGNILTQALDAIYYGIVTLAQGAYTLTASVLDSVFSVFGILGFTGAVTDFITDLATYFVISVTYVTTMIVSIFTLFASIGIFIIEWFGRIVTTILSIGTIMVSIIDGTSDYATGFGDILSMFDNLGTEFWTNFIPLVMVIYWFNSIDDRAKKLGAGWMGIFMSDIQSIMSVLSFMLDLSWRIVNTVIDLSMRFINVFMP